jgi:hypothetical protein
MSNLIQGSAGVAGATVSYTGTASGSVTSDNQGVYTIQNLGAGSYTITPTLSGFTFSPSSLSKTIVASNILGANFTASDGNTSWSEVDSRTTPNTTVEVQGTQGYVVTPTPSHAQPINSDVTSPVDSRKTKFTNSRTAPPFED